MIQTGSFLNVVDNSGAKSVLCIKVLSGYQRRYAKIGDQIIVSVKKLRAKRRALSKVKKGEIYHALIVRTVNRSSFLQGDSIAFYHNAVVLLNKQSKNIGTRVFGSMPKMFRFTRHLKLLFLAAGIVP